MAVSAGPGAQPEECVEGGAVQDRVVPGPFDGGAVIGVQGVEPAAAEVVLHALAGDVAPLRAVLVDLASGIGDPGDLVADPEQGPQALLLAVRAAAVADREEGEPNVVGGGVGDGEPGEVP